MKTENVTVWECDSAKGHTFDYDRKTTLTDEPTRRPDGWLVVHGADDHPLTFCSPRCAYMHLLDLHTQLEGTEAA